ncbi:MAG: MG2 domain-containing protein [Bacteroides sp.]|nr:MG2 domain-containing protein [Bacteroides sp.]
MKNKIILFISLFLLTCLMPLTMCAQTYDQLWKEVENAQKKSLPQTAVKLTRQIFSKAEAEKNSPQMLKAYVTRASLQKQITPDSLYTDLKGMEEWVKNTTNSLDCAILHTLIAMQYSEFVNYNYWQVRQQTDIIEQPSDDIREWSRNMFLDKIKHHTQAALEDSVMLLKTSSKDYIPFVILGAGSEYYHHEMYHTLAKYNIDALKLLEQLDSRKDVSVLIDRIYSKVLNTYRVRNNVEGEILISLEYLRWQRNNYTLDKKKDYLKTLDQLINKYQSNPITAEVYLAKGNYLVSLSKNVEALAVYEEAIRRYPNYNRVGMFKAAKEDVLHPSLYIMTDNIAYPEAPFTLRVNHRNLDGFTVSLYRVSLPVTSSLLRKNIDADFYKKYATKIHTQQFTLKRPADYLSKDTTITMTAPSAGLYILQMVSDVNKKKVIESFFSVTPLKSLSRKLPDDKLEIAVVDAQSGKPVSDAQVRLFKMQKGLYSEQIKQTTGADGKLVIDWKDNYEYLSVAKETGTATLPQRIYPGYYHYGENNNSGVIVQLLTDRSIYRPGQTVYVKGVASQRQAKTAVTLSGASYKLTLRDANYQEVAVKDVRTNEFGSFTAEFVLPSGGLNGTYFLNTERGSTTIRVEEYKRPTFDITFDKQKGGYQLGDSIQVKGQAKTFSGVSMQDQQVEYVVRRSYNPWWRGYNNYGTQIASGTVTSDASGEFNIPVHLLPDDYVSDNRWGYYAYTVEAKVTNEAGETQTSTTEIRVGERSFALSISLSDKILKDNPIKTVIKAENLDFQPVNVEGVYKVYLYSDYKDKKLADESLLTGKFTSNQEMELTGLQSLPSGAYKIKLSAKDEQGRDVEAESDFILFSLKDTRPPVEEPMWMHPINVDFDAYNPGSFIFGTSQKDAYILMDVFSGNKRLESRVLNLSDSLVRFDYPYKPEYGDGITVAFCFVKNEEVYQQNVQLIKKQESKELTLSWEVFRDKLRPGQNEEWKLTIKNPQGMPVDAELLATMYDASLDKIWGNNQALQMYYPVNVPTVNWSTSHKENLYYGFWFETPKNRIPDFPVFDSFFMDQLQMMNGGGKDFNLNLTRGKVRASSARTEVLTIVENSEEIEAVSQDSALPTAVAEVKFESEVVPITGSGGALEEMPELRTNFAETAFFYPQLRTNEQGEIVIAFTMPESLTKWSFRGYAHTKDMLIGMINGTATTSKDFMITPNLPRFVRVGDKTSVAASVANLTEKAVSGTVTLTLFDPVTEKVISTQKQKFSTEAGKTVGVSFMFTATDKYNLLGCRLVAQGGNFSDGEQHILPVLSNKENIIETIAMPMRGNETREFSLQSLFNNQSKTATDRRLTVEFSGNPAWYAVQSLPSLSLSTSDNAISWATVYYANSLAAYIANAQPRIKAVFDAWRDQGGSKESFLTNLEKNQDVKNILLEESPWLMEATNETERMRRIATLFDLNNIRNNNLTAQNKLKELQLADGSWTWYKGMQGSTYITNFVVETLSRLTKLTDTALDNDALTMQSTALNYLHKEALRDYRNILKAEKEGRKMKGISGNALQYLYLVTLSGQPVPAENKEAHNYYVNKIPESITSLSLREKAYAAIVLNKAGKTADAQAFIASMKEHAVQTDELGMHFAFNENPYSWMNLKVPVHVAVMEAMDEVTKDKKVVEEMKLWLLKQKQTQQWDSPVSTVNAIYALLHRGNNLLTNQGDVRISLGGKTMETLSTSETSIPGLAYVKEVITDNSTISKANKVTVEKRDEGIAWGAVYAQFQEDIDKVSQQGAELNVDKKLYMERLSGAKKEWVPVTSDTRLAIGDKVISRVTIRLDRAMDFVQLKDQRGACFEPIGNLSGYMWNNGIGYYVAVKDASTNFFFDSLNKGVYVLEYSYRVSRAGTYESGLAVMQSAYAPEYASHSASMKVNIDK